MSMDRREAIKKLAVGGATVATASVVMTSPAFAFDVPTPPNNPEFAVGTSGGEGSDLRVTVRPGTPSCGASLPNGGSVVAVFQSSSAAGSATAATPTGSGTGGDLVVEFTRPSALFAATATIEYSVQYQCDYPTPTQTCRSWTITFTTIDPIFTAFHLWNPLPSISAPGTTCP